MWRHLGSDQKGGCARSGVSGSLKPGKTGFSHKNKKCSGTGTRCATYLSSVINANDYIGGSQLSAVSLGSVALAPVGSVERVRSAGSGHASLGPEEPAMHLRCPLGDL